jgi:mono/diheme cytochrome c family protein
MQVAINFASPEWQSGIDDAAIARTIAGGKPPTMPAFADLLTQEQIAELVEQVRAFGE